MSFPWFLSMSVGFLSLSQEILWMRYMGFASQGMPPVFSFVLAIYLMGIAFGAYVGRIFCAKVERLYTMSAMVLLLGSVLDMFGPLMAAPPAFRFLVPFFIFLCAMLKSIVFPIAHHLGSAQAGANMGKSVSRVYFMNIVGSALGPLITGFWLVDHVTLQQAMEIMAGLTALLALAAFAQENKRGSVITMACVPLFLGLFGFAQPHYVTQQLSCYTGGDTSKIRHIIETKSGIIHSLVVDEEHGGDLTMGGNAYDGRASIDPRVNSNMLERVFALAVLKPQPERVLIVGMSSGAWSRVITSFPGVKRIDIIEINPGYLKLIDNYPAIKPFLEDPRVHVHIDDGRRWLKRHPDDRFDLIVMNTTYWWRAYTTNLLSQEFLRIVQAHLNEGGIAAYNSTYSPDVLKTAESVFPYAFRYENFVVVSDQDFRPRLAGGESKLWELKLDGKPVFDRHNEKDKEFIEKIVSVSFITSKDQVKEVRREGDVITDWNMITEYKYGRSQFEACH